MTPSFFKKRPDFLFRTPYGIIIVENDEHQHSGYNCNCEQARMIMLHQDAQEATHIIRFNPDRYVSSSTGEKTYTHLQDRFKALLKILKPLLKNSLPFFKKFPGLSVRYMYYNQCDTELHFSAREIAY